jgi:hypothetical protein
MTSAIGMPNSKSVVKALPSQVSVDALGNLSVSGSVSAGNMGMFRNKIINGCMRVDQRKGGNAFSVQYVNTPLYGSVDRYIFYNDGFTAYLAQQVAISDLKSFSHALRITSNNTVATAPNASLAFLGQIIEGINVYNSMRFGTAYAAPSTLSFWVKSSVVGTYHARIQYYITIQNEYLIPYTISSANVWEYKMFVIPPALSPSVEESVLNTPCYVTFTLVSGQLSQGGSGLAWSKSNSYGTGNQANLFSSSTNTFWLTGLQYEVGTLATPFEVRPYDVELQLCKRYFQKLPNMIAHGLDSTSMLVQCIATVEFRSTPSPSLTTTSPVWESTPWSAAATASGVGLGGGHLNVLGGDILISGTFTPILVKNTVYIFNRDQLWMTAEL